MVRFNIRILLFTTCVFVMGSGIAFAQNWQAAANTGISGTITSLAIAANGDIFAGTVGGPLNTAAGVYLSTDNGGTWTAMQSSSESPLGPVYGIDSKGEVFVQGYPGEYFSTDNGGSWQGFRITPLDPYDPVISSFAIAPHGYMFVSTQGADLFATANFDSAWYDQGVFSDGFDFPTFVSSSPEGVILAGTQSMLAIAKGISGGSWTTINNPPAFGSFVSFAYAESGMIVAGGTSGLFFSTDNGSQWTTITPSTATSGTYYALAVGSNGNIFAGMSSGGISVSADTGKTWTDISSGLTPTTVNALAINRDGTLFAATNNGVFQYLTPTGSVKSRASNAPSSLTLDQNTPNPVSSSTTIQFAVPEAGPVSLRIFDVTGRQVATIANGFYAPGTYTVSFDAGNLVSGVYIYRLEANGQSVARTCVVSP
jgi:photosystem II stability/assembly factor-like uncharacterized protein